MVFLTTSLLLRPQNTPVYTIPTAGGCGYSMELTGFHALQVHIGNDEFMHLRVFRSLPHENKPLSLHSYQSSKTKHDELAFF